MKWFIRGVGALLALVVIAATTVLLLDVPNRPAKPDLAPLIARADQYDVRIRRDRWGVPHVLGRRDADAAFGLAFAHSEDDFPTIQQVALATRGALAAEEGLGAAPGDYIVSLLEVWKTVDAGYSTLPADVRAVLEAYADGVNYYAATHPGEVAPGLLPLTGKDIAAGFVFKTPFFYGLDGELRKLNEREPDPLPKGSNGVAVAPARSTDGATRLLVNSHQPYTGPVAWYEAVVQSGEGWHVAGGFFPGAPFMLHGHNAHLGWANTVNNPDLIDVYRLVINPDNAGQYRLDGQWKDFERSEARLRVKLWGPFRWTVKRPVLRSVHGPVLETKSGVYALRYAGMGEARQPLQYWRLNRATNLAQWQAAMALQALPSINYIYADKAGNIGYVYNGLFPDRREGVDWSGVLPGDRSDLVWQGYRPFDQVPQLWNPKSGLVFNANNTPYQSTALGDGMDPAAYPASMGVQTNMTNRAWRLTETYAADPAISGEAFRAYKYDLAYSRKSELAGVMADIAALDAGSDADLKAARALLAGWNLRTDRDNRAAALGVTTAVAVINGRTGDGPRVSVRDALTTAIRSLKTGFGRIDPTWGEVNRLRRGDVDLPIDGGPDILRAVYGAPQKDSRLTGVAGDTYIMFVTWDRAGALSSESIHQFGSGAERPASKHYADQAALFAAMKTRPVLFTEAQLAGKIAEDYRPGQREKAP